MVNQNTVPMSLPSLSCLVRWPSSRTVLRMERQASIRGNTNSGSLMRPTTAEPTESITPIAGFSVRPMHPHVLHGERRGLSANAGEQGVKAAAVRAFVVFPIEVQGAPDCCRRAGAGDQDAMAANL